jgi:hypothetical protein
MLLSHLTPKYILLIGPWLSVDMLILYHIHDTGEFKGKSYSTFSCKVLRYIVNKWLLI